MRPRQKETPDARQRRLENYLNHAAGLPAGSIRITIRSEHQFTVSFDGRNDIALEKLMAYFRGIAKQNGGYDVEADLSYLYIDARAGEGE